MSNGLDLDRKTEKRLIESAVRALLDETGLSAIPLPRNFAAGVGINDMTAFPGGAGGVPTLGNYMAITTTKYYYTCEADGTIRQWSDAAMTIEYEA